MFECSEMEFHCDTHGAGPDQLRCGCVVVARAAATRMKRKPWTEAENERLKLLLAQGASVVRAAAALNRSMVNIRNQSRKFGRPFPPGREYRKKQAARQ